MTKQNNNQINKTESINHESDKVLRNSEKVEGEAYMPPSTSKNNFNQSQYLRSLNKIGWLITVEEYYTPAFRRGFKLTEPLPKILEQNLINLLTQINKVRFEFKKPMIVSSGARSPEHNATVGGATHSTHQSNEGIDISDISGDLRRFLMSRNCEILKELDLYIEHPAYTKGWCHIQTRRPKSGNRIFIPYTGKPKKEHYDSRFKL